MEATKKLQTITLPDGVKIEKTPNIAVETFLSLVKYFLIIIVIINAIWAGIFIYILSKASVDTTNTTEMWQDGTNNKQSITNG